MSRVDPRDRLQRAADVVGDRQRAGVPSRAIIAELTAGHGAAHRCTPSTNTLRVAGVQASCTWSEDDGLLAAWIRRAALKLMEPVGGYGDE